MWGCEDSAKLDLVFFIHLNFPRSEKVSIAKLLPPEMQDRENLKCPTANSSFRLNRKRFVWVGVQIVADNKRQKIDAVILWRNHWNV